MPFVDILEKPDWLDDAVETMQMCSQIWSMSSMRHILHLVPDIQRQIGVCNQLSAVDRSILFSYKYLGDNIVNRYLRSDRKPHIYINYQGVHAVPPDIMRNNTIVIGTSTFKHIPFLLHLVDKKPIGKGSDDRIYGAMVLLANHSDPESLLSDAISIYCKRFLSILASFPPITMPMVVDRKWMNAKTTIADICNGTLFRSYGLVSTTYHQNLRTFIRDSSIFLPEGSRAIFIDLLVSTQDSKERQPIHLIEEFEIILPQDSIFYGKARIKSICQMYHFPVLEKKDKRFKCKQFHDAMYNRCTSESILANLKLLSKLPPNLFWFLLSKLDDSVISQECRSQFEAYLREHLRTKSQIEKFRAMYGDTLLQLLNLRGYGIEQHDGGGAILE